jgi:hypothetical protein
MKIIITEKQYKILESQQDDERVVRNALHTIWQDELDSTGEIDFDTKIANYIGYKRIGHVHEIYRDFLGGWDKMVEKSFELMDRTFDTMDYDFSGGYDFRFTVKGNNDYEEGNILYVNSQIESDGKVELIMTDGGNISLGEALASDDYGWEIESEIRSVIEDILYKEVTKKTGILIEVNNFWIK